jgi:type VI secretion system secreted protein VgrG
VSDLTFTSEPRPGKVVLRDYDFEKPRLGLEVEEEADRDGDLEVFDVPGRYTDEEAGQRRARLRLEALRCGRNRVTAVSSALGLAVGHTVTVEGHPYEALNGELHLTAVRIVYAEAQGTSRVELEGVPLADGPVRPALRPAAAVVAGLQSAFVTGASGQEIAADGHGRVTVWFPWDRKTPKDDGSSLPIRTLQIALGGSQLTPRVGWEVSVGAFEGDLDAPLVLGRMMNAAAPPPYPLPAGKTKFAIQTATTPGDGTVNEIRFDDAAGGEELFVNASKDASVGVGNDATDAVTVDEVRTVGGDQSIEVGGGWTGVFKSNQTITIGGSQTVKAATKGVDESGSHTLAMGGSRSLTIGGDYRRTASGASALSIGGNAIDLVIGSFDTKAKATFTETIGAADVILTSKRSLHVVGARTEKAGAAKVLLVGGDRAVAAASLDHEVAGAIGAIVKGDRSEEASGDFTEVAVGAHVIQGTNVVFEAESLLSIVMGASTLTLTPSAIALAGVKVTFDGTAVEGTAVLDL